MLHRTGKRIVLLVLCLALMLSALPLTAFAAREDTLTAENPEQAEALVQPRYSIDGKYQLTFRGYINGRFESFFTLAIPCGYKTVTADYIWALDPKNPYGNNYGWLLRINGTVCSTIYGTNYGFPNGIPGLSITTSQHTGNYSFINTHDMSNARWTYNIPNTGNGNVTTSLLGSAAAINVSVPIDYKVIGTNDVVATDSHRITAYGKSVAYANAAKVPSGYVLEPASQSQEVLYSNTSASPSRITFYVRATAVEATLKVKHVLLNGPEEGAVFEEDIVLSGIGSHTILPAPGIVPSPYVLAPSTPVSHDVTVNSDGTVTPDEVIFRYYHPYW